MCEEGSGWKDSLGNRKIGPGDDRVGWGWRSNHADYFPLIASVPNATQLLHDKCAGALLCLVFRRRSLLEIKSLTLWICSQYKTALKKVWMVLCLLHIHMLTFEIAYIRRLGSTLSNLVVDGTNLLNFSQSKQMIVEWAGFNARLLLVSSSDYTLAWQCLSVPGRGPFWKWLCWILRSRSTLCTVRPIYRRHSRPTEWLFMSLCFGCVTGRIQMCCVTNEDIRTTTLISTSKGLTASQHSSEDEFQDPPAVSTNIPYLPPRCFSTDT